MKNKGLTLIELLVVIGIVVIMAGVFVANYDNSGESIELLNAVNDLKQNVAKAREMALSGVGGEENTAYGVGVWFGDVQGKEYYIYRNQGTPATPAYGLDEGADFIIEKIHLEDGIKYELKEEDTGVLFVPPDPYVVICQDSSCLTNGLQFEIYLYKEEDEGILDNYKLIRVNSLGSIEEINE